MNEITNIATIVVIYNTKCCESPTCCALEKIKNINLKVLIYDNSTSDFGNKSYCEEMGWTFLGGTGNVGISKAYNACIEHLSTEKFYGIVCLFDDDTHISEEYFKLLTEASNGAKEDIFVPLIFANNKLLSPCLLGKGHKVIPIQDINEALNYRGNDISAINSGMAIDMSIFKSYRYDENIFLDGIDHNFITEMKKRGEKIKVFPYQCEHMFSGVEKPPKSAALTRFRIYAKDYRYILREDKLSYLKLIGKRALSLSLKYKTLVFFLYL